MPASRAAAVGSAGRWPRHYSFDRSGPPCWRPAAASGRPDPHLARPMSGKPIDRAMPIACPLGWRRSRRSAPADHGADGVLPGAGPEHDPAGPAVVGRRRPGRNPAGCRLVRVAPLFRTGRPLDLFRRAADWPTIVRLGEQRCQPLRAVPEEVADPPGPDVAATGGPIAAGRTARQRGGGPLAWSRGTSMAVAPAEDLGPDQQKSKPRPPAGRGPHGHPGRSRGVPPTGRRLRTRPREGAAPPLDPLAAAGRQDEGLTAIHARRVDVSANGDRDIPGSQRAGDHHPAGTGQAARGGTSGPVIPPSRRTEIGHQRHCHNGHGTGLVIACRPIL